MRWWEILTMLALIGTFGYILVYILSQMDPGGEL